MNLRTINSNVARWLCPTEKDKAEITHQISERLRYNRQLLKRSGTVWDDEAQAQKIAQSRRQRLKFWLNQRLISAEKRRVEPTAKWVYGADLFKIIESLSPTLEALGVIAIPLVLFLSTQSYQRRLLQHQAVTGYFDQLSTILLDVEGDLDDLQNQKLQTLTIATTLTLLRDPNLDGYHKGQVIQFLSQMNLVNRGDCSELPKLDDVTPILSLKHANLSYADLSLTNLNYANLSYADLSYAHFGGVRLCFANLGGSNLRGADLEFTNLNDAFLDHVDLRHAYVKYSNLRDASLEVADLRYANLSDTDLRNASFNSADLRNTNLSYADLSQANLRHANIARANLHRANLSFADLRNSQNLTQSQLENADLCETQLPETINLNPDRDC